MQGWILTPLSREGGLRSCSSLVLLHSALHTTILQCRGRKQGTSDVGNCPEAARVASIPTPHPALGRRTATTRPKQLFWGGE